MEVDIPDMDVITSLASTRVFGIVELLENILIFAEVFDLFVIQRVNSTFRDVIANSASIHKAMHLEPQAATDDIEIVSRRNLLRSKKVKAAMFPFEVAAFATPLYLKVTIPDDYRRMETTAGRRSLEVLRLTDSSWKNIQIGTSNQRLQLIITGGGRWRTTSMFSIEVGADLGCVVKAVCESVTDYWRAERYIDSLSPWQRLIHVVETGGRRFDDTLRHLERR